MEDNKEITFCDECAFFREPKPDRCRCSKTGRSIKFYTRACDDFTLPEEQEQKGPRFVNEYNPETNRFELKKID